MHRLRILAALFLFCAAGSSTIACAHAEPISSRPATTPCRVDLEYTFRDVDVSDDAFKTVHLKVTRLVHDLDSRRYDIDWLTAPVGPVPLTIAQARAMPGAHEDRRLGIVTVPAADSTSSYGFDAEGRTTSVEFDPVADSAVYRFSYRYDCGSRSVTSPSAP